MTHSFSLSMFLDRYQVMRMCLQLAEDIGFLVNPHLYSCGSKGYLDLWLGLLYTNCISNFSGAPLVHRQDLASVVCNLCYVKFLTES